MAETPSRPPPLMANAIKNFHFDFPHPSLSQNIITIFWDLEPRLVREVIIVITIFWDTVSMGKV